MTRSPPHRGVDRNAVTAYAGEQSLRSPPHRGVDRNWPMAGEALTLDVAPSQGRGSKHARRQEGLRPQRSPPHRGVDRNSLTLDAPLRAGLSPPHRGVDRNEIAARRMHVDHRRPLTGAWIETISRSRSRTGRRSSPPHRGVDRNNDRSPGPALAHGVAPSQGRGSKPRRRARRYRILRSPPHRGVDRNRPGRRRRRLGVRRPLTGAWIETSLVSLDATLKEGRPLTGAWIETRLRPRAN